jgi:hypothetical protein
LEVPAAPPAAGCAAAAAAAAGWWPQTAVGVDTYIAVRTCRVGIKGGGGTAVCVGKVWQCVGGVWW